MKCCILGVALCLLLLQLQLANAHKAVPCYGITYYDCYQYCHGQCHGPECFHRCNSGCGCQEAYIIRNNGACRKLEVCQVGDDDEDPLDQDGELQLFNKLNPSDPDAGIDPDTNLGDRLPPPGHTHTTPPYMPYPSYPYPPPGKNSHFKRPPYPNRMLPPPGDDHTPPGDYMPYPTHSYPPPGKRPRPDAGLGRTLPPPGHDHTPPGDYMPYPTHSYPPPGKRPRPDAGLNRMLPPPGHINHPPRDYLPYTTYTRPPSGKRQDPDADLGYTLPPTGHNHTSPPDYLPPYPRPKPGKKPLWSRPPDPNRYAPNRMLKPPHYTHMPLPPMPRPQLEPCIDSEDSDQLCEAKAPLWIG